MGYFPSNIKAFFQLLVFVSCLFQVTQFRLSHQYFIPSRFKIKFIKLNLRIYNEIIKIYKFYNYYKIIYKINDF